MRSGVFQRIPINDLDKFLKSDGLRILMESSIVRTEPCEPLTVNDIEDFESMNLDNLDSDHLEDLLDKADELLDDLGEKEPDHEGSEEYDFWAERFAETEEFISHIQDRLGLLEDSDDE